MIEPTYEHEGVTVCIYECMLNCFYITFATTMLVVSDRSWA